MGSLFEKVHKECLGSCESNLGIPKRGNCIVHYQACEYFMALATLNFLGTYRVFTQVTRPPGLGVALMNLSLEEKWVILI